MLIVLFSCALTVLISVRLDFCWTLVTVVCYLQEAGLTDVQVYTFACCTARTVSFKMLTMHDYVAWLMCVTFVFDFTCIVILHLYIQYLRGYRRWASQFSGKARGQF